MTNDTLNLDPSDYIAIYPPIGIARVGNSMERGNDGWFYSPEEPLRIVKRQAVKFKVYAFHQNGEPFREITYDKKYKVEWTVHVKNKKASWYYFAGKFRPNHQLRNPNVQRNLEPDNRNYLIIDPGRKTISG
ncbi:hypothetical protein BC936DRAFT_138794 [Jimgerdemannia flammicorona]|uniref:L-Lysine epsilon oxidase N-terminal domain-containing protein n=1 Tax=Jimgerdemannia flammicorona TaxID=994334 RepID=A0A433BIN7_9FUNG|nr:hypothetical protein BC936DRAFT_138794 [Jimgerdemannia flammicorona]